MWPSKLTYTSIEYWVPNFLRVQIAAARPNFFRLEN